LEQSKNSENQVDHRLQPKQVRFKEDYLPSKPVKQVRFLLPPLRKANSQNNPVHRQGPHKPPSHPDPLHHHSQRHQSRLQEIHHLIHQDPQQWPSQTNHASWGLPQNHMMVHPIKP